MGLRSVSPPREGAGEQGRLSVQRLSDCHCETATCLPLYVACLTCYALTLQGLNYDSMGASVFGMSSVLKISPHNENVITTSVILNYEHQRYNRD